MAPEDHRTPKHAVDGAPLRRPYAASRRVVWISVGVSAVVHLLALWLYPMAMGRGGPDGPTYWYVPPEFRPRVPAEGVPARSPTAAEVLRPKLGDARLWRSVDPALLELTEEEVLHLQLEGRLETWNDSVAEVRAREEEALDWTHTDEEGKRWGISPGKIHLGDTTIPFPFGFSAPPAGREQAARRQWEWDEIEAAAASGAIRATWKDRAAAIRARKEAERAIELARQKAKAPPDTTRVNRR